MPAKAFPTDFTTTAAVAGVVFADNGTANYNAIIGAAGAAVLSGTTSIPIPVGPVTAPGLSVVGDPNTGITQLAASPDTLDVVLNGASIAHFSAGGSTLKGVILMPDTWQTIVASPASLVGCVIENTDTTGFSALTLSLVDQGSLYYFNSALSGQTGAFAVSQLALHNSGGAGGVGIIADSGPIRLGTSSDEWVRVFLDGGVQIGGTYTTSPGAGNLQIEGDAKFHKVFLSDYDQYSSGAHTLGNLLLGNNLAGGTGGQLFTNTHVTAIGRDLLVYGFSTGSVVIGYGITISGGDTITIGRGGTNVGAGSVGIGRSVYVAHPYSVAIGHEATTTQNYQVVLGSVTSGVETTQYLLKGAATSVVYANGLAVGNTALLSTFINSTFTPRTQFIGTTAPYASTGHAVFSATASPRINIARSKGATVGDYTPVVSTDVLGRIEFEGSDGTALIESVIITGSCNGTVSTGIVPGALTIGLMGSGGVVNTTLTLLSDLSATFAGVVAIPAGTAALPSLAFAADLNTGLWSPAGDTIGISLGGSEKMRWFSDGGVQIGGTYTTSPGAGALSVAFDSTINSLRIATNFTGASDNTLVGKEAGAAVTSQNGSVTCFGYQAGKAITSATLAVIVGRTAGLAHVTGDRVVYVGTSAGYHSNGCADNTYIGHRAGTNFGTNNVTNNQCTMVGSQANCSADALANATALGYLAQATASNQIMLGNTSVTSVVTTAAAFHYYGDPAAVGTWRTGRSGNNLVIERCDTTSGVFVTKQTILA